MTTSVAMNVQARGNILRGIDRILNKPAVSVYRTSTESISNSTVTEITWDTAEINTDGMWAASPTGSRVTCVTAGIYSCIGWAEWAATATGIRQLGLFKNSTTLIAPVVEQNPTAGATTNQVSAALVQMNAGDWIEVRLFQNSGGAINIDAWTTTNRVNGLQACLIST